MKETSRIIVDGGYKYTVWCANFVGTNPNSILVGILLIAGLIA
jgi:hypothetical protein